MRETVIICECEKRCTTARRRRAARSSEGLEVVAHLDGPSPQIWGHIHEGRVSRCSVANWGNRGQISCVRDYDGLLRPRGYCFMLLYLRESSACIIIMVTGLKHDLDTAL